MSDEGDRICNELDAALFSSDTFESHLAVQGLRKYLERWQREIDSISRMLKAKEKTNGSKPTIET